ncbi:MAG: YgiT-type zinc finger protein [Chitinivibrionales bacterium]|nr:YgiT-type zinc finger protein [Chitinivibrionales bacterium]
MECEFCGGQTTSKRAKKQHWLKKKFYIVENVEAEVCRECGERCFSAKTLDTIATINGKHIVKEVLSVEVLTA